MICIVIMKMDDTLLELNEVRTLYYYTPGEMKPFINHTNFNITNNSEQGVYFLYKESRFYFQALSG